MSEWVCAPCPFRCQTSVGTGSRSRCHNQPKKPWKWCQVWPLRECVAQGSSFEKVDVPTVDAGLARGWITSKNGLARTSWLGEGLQDSHSPGPYLENPSPSPHRPGGRWEPAGSEHAPLARH